MPIPDTQGVPPFAEFDDLKRKINELVQKYNNLLVNLDSLNVVSLTADHVDTGTLDANVVTIAAEDGSYSYTLDGTGIKANNGAVDTLKFDLATGLLTIVSALIQSASGYPRVTLDPTNNNFRIDQNATSALIFNPNYLGNTPVINFHYGSLDGYIGYFNSSNKIVMTSPDGVEIELSNGGLSGDISLRPVDFLNVPQWSRIINESTMSSLQDALNAKQNVISGFTGSFSTGTQTVFVSNGIIVSVV